jgi:hypothetical protein
MTTHEKAFQDVWPALTCFGCGPGNPDGLHIKSFWSEDGRFAVATIEVDPKYNAGLPNIMYGGTVASLIDCHSIWTAIAAAYREEKREIGAPPIVAFVTKQITVKYLKPTPLGEPIHLKAWTEGEIGRKVHVRCELGPEGDITATGEVIASRLG